MLCPAASANWSSRKVGAGANFLQSSYSSGFNMSGVQGRAFLVNQAQSCSLRLWGVGTASSTKTLWYGALSKMMRECDGIEGSNCSANHVEKCSQCICP